VLRTCRMYRPKPTGNTSAVNWMSFWMPWATDGWNRPADSSRRLAIRLLWREYRRSLDLSLATG